MYCKNRCETQSEGKTIPRLRSNDRVGKEVQTSENTPRVCVNRHRRDIVCALPIRPRGVGDSMHVCYRKVHDARLVSSQCTLIIASNLLSGEVKYFISNRVLVGTVGPYANCFESHFSRWKVEACFREVKEELGWDTLECAGWGCVHRH